MEEFWCGALVIALALLLPVYFFWFLTCIAQGYWITMNIFEWIQEARIVVIIWFLCVSFVGFMAFLNT